MPCRNCRACSPRSSWPVPREVPCLLRSLRQPSTCCPFSWYMPGRSPLSYRACVPNSSWHFSFSVPLGLILLLRPRDVNSGNPLFVRRDYHQKGIVAIQLKRIQICMWSGYYREVGSGHEQRPSAGRRVAIAGEQLGERTSGLQVAFLCIHNNICFCILSNTTI